MKCIAVINQKGGVGKSTTAAALMAGFTLKGFKVLGIDLDAQSNLSYTVGADIDKITSLDVLLGAAPASEAIQHTKSGDIIPASYNMSGAEASITKTGKEYKLKEAIEPIKNNYDYIIIDTPPTLGILTINALTFCNSALIPLQADIYSLQGVGQLWETITPVKKYCNHDLEIEGLLLTRYSPRAILNKEMKEMAEGLAIRFNTRLFKTTIREAVAIKESQLTQQSIFEYAPKAKVTEDYKALINEILETEEKK